ncbi:hypothetical protein [Vannielia sp. SX4]|uniref:hypothetical protein n=1 Tax=Vannielia sp. SX4 TaxID=3463852 RepID=UPI00405811E3
MLKYFTALSVAAALSTPAAASDMKTKLAEKIGVSPDAYVLNELIVLAEVSGFQRNRLKAAIDSRKAREVVHLQQQLGVVSVTTSTSN